MSGMKCLTISNSVFVESSQALHHQAWHHFYNICSYRQTTRDPVYHFHLSAKEVRLMQGLEHSDRKHDYFCPTCMTTHPTYTDYGLNMCLSDSQLYNVHHPRDQNVVCPPDAVNIDWVTISGGMVHDLTHAYIVDYKKSPRPMGILVAAGLNDIPLGATRDTVVEIFIHLKETIDAQNVFHPYVKNELVMRPYSTPKNLSGCLAMGSPLLIL